MVFVAAATLADEVVAALLDPGVSRELAAWRSARYRNIRYSLHLELAAGAPRLSGIAEIEVTLDRPADLVLDWRPGRDAHLSDIEVNGAPAGDAKLEREHLVVPRNLVRPGTNLVRARFESPISVSGSAVTRYRDREDGSEYVYSLFVPADASSVFPCFDQPDLKGRFTLELTAPERWTVIGNGSLRESPDFTGTGTRRWRFEETPPISTYLFAFAAGPFAELREPGYPTRLYARRSRAQRAAQEAPEVLRLNREALAWLERYFDHPFPFPKHDMVLIPELAYGGMEHAGATFLREESVLFPSEPNENDRLRRAQLVFHEASHQWFGNLVTMKWFDDLWLKEGFANFMAAKATEALLPQFNAWIAFHAVKVAAYRTDVTRGTTPIYQPLPNLSAAKSAYGNIVYSKAPAVLRQAEFYVGEEAFRTAVRRVVDRYAYGSADWSDLVRSLEQASGMRLKGWADAWVKRRGMPRVRISWNTDAHGNLRDASLSQEDVLGEGGVWPLRVRLAAVAESQAPHRFDVLLRGKRTAVKQLDGLAPPDLMFANDGDYGYGQFLLDERSLKAVLARPEIAREDLLRALLLDSVWDSVREAELAPADYIEFALRLAPQERDPVTLSTLLARTVAAFEHYLSAKQRDAIAPRLERTLFDNMRAADTPGRRISFLRAFMACAWSNAARGQLKDLVSGRLDVPGVPLSSRDRFRIIARLLALGDAAAPALLAAQAAKDTGDDARRYAYAAAAARGDPGVKREYFDRALHDPSLPESWIEAALDPLNPVEQAQLTLPLLGPALRALPKLKRDRKVFFLNHWLAAFLGGQTSAQALEQVERFLREPGLEDDLRLKVLEAVDPLERTVKILARYGTE